MTQYLVNNWQYFAGGLVLLIVVGFSIWRTANKPKQAPFGELLNGDPREKRGR